MQKTIFVVDDNDTNLTQAKQVLEGRYRVFTLPSAEKLFVLLEKIHPDMILLDIEMPGRFNGFDAIVKLKESPDWQNIPVLFLTAWHEEMMVADGLDLGALDFILKPFPSPILLKRVENYLEMDALAKNRPEILRIEKDIISLVSNLIEIRDKTAGGHVYRISEYTRNLIEAMLARGVYAKELQHWNMDNVLVAAMLHDVGKIVVCDTILNKPNQFTIEDYSEVWDHASAGERFIDELISNTGDDVFWQHVKHFVGYHHEKWDGSGYPHELKGEQIPLEARILAPVDMYDMLISGRPNRPALGHTQAIKYMQRESAARFDPKVAEVFMDRKIAALPLPCPFFTHNKNQPPNHRINFHRCCP